jgi:hypothetical protein
VIHDGSDEVVEAFPDTGLSSGGSGAGDMMKAGFTVAGTGVGMASDFDTEHQKGADEREDQALQSLRNYRMVRFLPEWVSIEPQKKAEAFASDQVFLKAKNSQTAVLFVNTY